MKKIKKLDKKIILGVITAILVLLVALKLTNTKQPTAESNTSQDPTSEQLQQEAEANAEKKQKIIEDQKAGSDSSSESTPARVIELSAKQESDNTVTVFTKLIGYSDGSCSLTVTNGNDSTTQTAPIIFQREASICAGFSVPIETLGFGSWTLNLNVTSDVSTKNKTITFEVR